MKKIIILTILSVLLSSTTFAVGNNSSGVPDHGLMTLSGTTTTFVSNTRVDVLISKLNKEYERIEANNSFEDVDLLTERGVDIVLTSMNIRDTEGLSETEVDEYVKSQFELIDMLDKYIQTLPDNNRKIFLGNAVLYMRELMIAD